MCSEARTMEILNWVKFLVCEKMGHCLLLMPATAFFLKFFPIWPLFTPKNDKIGFSPPVHALINDYPQKKLRASTGTHDPLFDNNGIWPSLIFSKFVLFGKSPKLPVCMLYHDPQKKSYRYQLGPMTSFSDQKKFDPLYYFQGLHPQTHFQSFLCMP